jgi:CRISPR/Cas system CMR subunit Cmr6 (Cas7 group RAMP superfamily)
MPGPRPPRTGRPRVEPDLVPLPATTASLYRSLAKEKVHVHPRYTLLKMVRWHEGWSNKPPRHAAKESATFGAFAFSKARELLEHKDLAKQVRSRRTAWILPLIVAGRARQLTLTATSNVVLHLASPGPLELGLAVHPTYGFPVLPATSLKGLANAQAAGQRATNARRLYGEQEAAGTIAFLDGLPIEWSVERDVMTPHFGGWYRGTALPDDTENPIPIPFLSIGVGSVFEVVLLARETDRGAAREDLDAADEDLRNGIEERGLGAKTAAGYGVFAIRRLEEETAPAPVPAEQRRSTAPDPGIPNVPPILTELRALKPGSVGSLAAFRDRCLALEDYDLKREAALEIVKNAGRVWIRKKAKDDGRWRALLELTEP